MTSERPPVCKRLGADVTSVLSLSEMNTQLVVLEILLVSIIFAAEVTLVRPFGRVNAHMSDKPCLLVEFLVAFWTFKYWPWVCVKQTIVSV